jgi:superfamily II DNA or RNA helicase
MSQEHLSVELRPYQEEALAAVLGTKTIGIFDGAEAPAALVSLPTGTGKTVVFSALASRREGTRALVVAHRDELLTQARDKLVHAGTARGAIGLVKAQSNEVGQNVVLASVQTVAHRGRLDSLLLSQREHGPFGTVIVDEAHHAPASSYVALLGALASTSGNDGALVVGMTATPGRKGLREMFGQPVYSRDLVDMIADGWLCDLRGRRVWVKADLNNVRMRGGDYSDASLAEALEDADAPTVVAKAWQEYAEGRPTICFTAGVRLAHETAEALVERGVAAETVDGAMPLEDRQAILERYRQGKTKVVVNCNVLTEGVDLPLTSCIVVARPTLSPLLYAQQIGRGTRLAPDKQDCLVLDLVGATGMHDLSSLGTAEPASLATLTGLEVEDGRSLLEAARADEKRRKALEDLLAQHGQLRSKEVVLFGRRIYHWFSLGSTPTGFAVSLGDQGHMVVVEKAPSMYSVYRAPRERDLPVVREGSLMTLDAATAMAEHKVRDADAWSLAAEGAEWRQEGSPATTNQVQLLTKLYPQYRGAFTGMTKGEASDWISRTFITQKLVRQGIVRRSRAA